MKEPITEKIYTCTGIIQQNLAVLAGVHPSTLNKFEKGIRDLPSHGLRTIAVMYDDLVKLPEPAPAIPTPQELERIRILANWCHAQAELLQQKLDAAVLGYRQGTVMLQWLQVYKAKATAPFSDKEQRWIESRQYEAEQKKEKNNWLQQQILATKLHAMRLEAEKYTKLLENI